MGGKTKSSKQTYSGTTNQTQTATPFEPAQPLLQDMLERARQAQASTPTTPVFTGPNANQTLANQFLLDFAPKANAGAGSVLDIANKTGSGYYLDPAHNPGLAGIGYSEGADNGLEAMIKAAINPLRDQLSQNILSVGDAAKLAGAYGGDRQDLLRGTVLNRFNRDAMDVGSTYSFNAYQAAQQRALAAAQADAQLRSQAFESERGRQGDVANIFAAANQLGLEPAHIISAVGDQQSQWDIAARTAALDAPWAGLDRYSQILQGIVPYATQTGNTVENSTTTGTPARSGGGIGGAASGALGGASAGAAFGPWGAGIGAVIGGLGGLFG